MKCYCPIALRSRLGLTLKIVLGISVAIFLFEFAACTLAGLTSLQTDSFESLDDALVYAFSLNVLIKFKCWRTTAALFNGLIYSRLRFGRDLCASAESVRPTGAGGANDGRVQRSDCRGFPTLGGLRAEQTAA